MAEAEAKRTNGIDAVVIATPNALHYPIAKEFIKKGINVISDKPLCINSKEANHLMQLKKKTQSIFWSNVSLHIARYDQASESYD